MTTPIAAVLFDLDGVLLDTEPLYTRATEAVVSQFGQSYSPELKRRIMGGSAKSGAEIVVRELGLPIAPDEYLRQRRVLLEQFFARTVPIDGAEALVRRLAGLGLRLAVATSSERSLFELKTKPHSWFSLFSQVVCGDDPRLKAPKPAPDIFHLAAATLGVRANECLVFEDSPAGVTAAVAAGATVVARRDPCVALEDLSRAHFIVSGYADLLGPNPRSPIAQLWPAVITSEKVGAIQEAD